METRKIKPKMKIHCFYIYFFKHTHTHTHNTHTHTHTHTHTYYIRKRERERDVGKESIYVRIFVYITVYAHLSLDICVRIFVYIIVYVHLSLYMLVYKQVSGYKHSFLHIHPLLMFFRVHIPLCQACPLTFTNQPIRARF